MSHLHAFILSLSTIFIIQESQNNMFFKQVSPRMPFVNSKEVGSEFVGYLLKKSEGKIKKIWQKRKCSIKDGIMSSSHSDVSWFNRYWLQFDYVVDGKWLAVIAYLLAGYSDGFVPLCCNASNILIAYVVNHLFWQKSWEWSSVIKVYCVKVWCGNLNKITSIFVWHVFCVQ